MRFDVGPTDCRNERSRRPTSFALTIGSSLHVPLNVPATQPCDRAALLLSLLVFTVVLTLFAWSNWFWATFLFFTLVGVTGVGMVWPLATTIIQVETSAEVRGRVMGMLQFTPGFHFLGAFPLALAAGQVGWEVAITGAVGLSLVTTVWFALVRPGKPKFNRQEAADS